MLERETIAVSVRKEGGGERGCPKTDGERLMHLRDGKKKQGGDTQNRIKSLARKGEKR